MNLYWKFVRAGYIEFESKAMVETHVGVPQGGIISPLLSNLVLHELDSYMERLKKHNESEQKGNPPSEINPRYRALTNKIYYLDQKQAKGKSSIQDTLRRTSLLKERRHTPPMIPNPEYCRYEYVRYADD